MHKKLVTIFDRVTPGATRSLGWEAIVTLLSFPTSVLLNRILGAEDRGLLALTILVPSTIFVLGSCQWDRLLKGLITSKQISAREGWFRTVYYTFLLSIIFVPIGIITSVFFIEIPFNIRWLSAIYCANFPIYFLGGSLSAIYVAIGSINGQYLMRIGLQGSYLILLFSLALIKAISIESMVVIYMAIHIVSLMFGWTQKERLLTGTLSKVKPQLFPLVQAFFPYLLESLVTKIDVWSFSTFGSLVGLGQYTGITALMLPVGLVSNAMTSGSTARLDWTQPNVVRRYLFKTAIVLLCLLVILVIAGVLVGPYLLSIVLGKSFESGEWMIAWIAAIVVSQAAATQFHSALQLSGSLNAYLMIQTIEPFVRLIIVLALGWRLSELGILLGMTVSSILKVVACIYLHQSVNFIKNR